MHLDNWGLKAKKLGYRSRAVFKLEEIVEKTKALKGCKNVLDIGAAPGGWSQFIRHRIKEANVYALDILDIDPIDGVKFHKIRIEDIDSTKEIFELKGTFHLVISDLAPNLTGISVIDESNIYELNDITLNVAVEYLDKSKGVFIIKTFQNSMLKKLKTKMKGLFDDVQIFKPAASKKQSAEIYLYGAFKE
ncbi:MAG: RlmE family RNA methyltransferase [SAR86 cluster bacterium]|jgi:23S rRNA (uridine2552-2'-O)-methyltransferase|uniref:Ribosomal RNA large subunit methyltransferase E n=1 Tax=SAR86 cluster bacterium TaxID=2030880 RepID=A0A937JHF9_9GAMM|nr:RlmE family RNA methyltransferase [SAR86 cluster bacterium]|tara:strand:+ start:49 stop:621 length:573 start_codon:yes stop_codon:yes gene_type:complete